MVKTSVLAVIVVCAGCGGHQSGGGGDHCAKVPAGKLLQPQMMTQGSYTAPENSAADEPIGSGEYVANGERRWGLHFGQSSDGAIRWVVETDTAIRIGYTMDSWCGGAPRPESAVAVRLPGTTKPIVAEQCGGHSSCEPNVP